MGKIVGVKAVNVFEPDLSGWKRDLLFFDQLYTWGSEELLVSLKNLGNLQEAQSFEALIGKNALIDIKETLAISPITREKSQKLVHDHIERLYKLNVELDSYRKNRHLPMPDRKDRLIESAVRIIELNDSLTRLTSIGISDKYGVTAIPLISSPLSMNSDLIENTKKSEVIEIAIKFLPIPTEDTPLEHILDFREDPDSRSKFLELRNWINETASVEISLDNIQDKLEYLLNQYEKHMQFHRMKYRKGRFETLVITTAEVLGNLTSFNWGKIAEMPFSIKNKQLALMEEEMKAPGKEVAYISKAREQFS